MIREVRRRNVGMVSSNLLSLSYGSIVRKDISASDGLLPESFETYNVISRNDVVLRLTDLQNDKRSLRSGLAPEDGIITSAYTTLRPVAVEPRFMAYQLRAIDLAKAFYSLGGGLRQSLGFDDIKTLPIAIPLADEQRQIADYLDHETAEIDAFISDLRTARELILARQEADLAERIRANSSPATTQERRGSFNTPEHDFGQGWIPLGSVARISTGFGDTQDAVPDGEYPFFVRSDTVERSDSYTFDTEAVLTAGDGAGVGKVFHHYRGKFAAHQRVYVIEPSVAVSGRFLYWSLRTFFGGIVLAGTAKSTVESLRRSMLTGFPLPALELAPQSRLAAEADHLEAQVGEQVADIDAAIALANERRAALITAAVTGQIDVTTKQQPVVDSIQTAIEESR